MKALTTEIRRDFHFVVSCQILGTAGLQGSQGRPCEWVGAVWCRVGGVREAGSRNKTVQNRYEAKSGNNCMVQNGRMRLWRP